MKHLFFYKTFDTALNTYVYVFELTSKLPINGFIHDFGEVPNEFHIRVLYSTITQLYITNWCVKWAEEYKTFDDIYKISFIPDVDTDFNVFIPQIIENISLVIDKDYR